MMGLEPLGLTEFDSMIRSELIQQILAERAAHEETKRNLATALPDDFSPSKDWAESDLFGRIDWLKCRAISLREESLRIADLEAQIAKSREQEPKQSSQDIIDEQEKRILRLTLYEKLAEQFGLSVFAEHAEIIEELIRKNAELEAKLKELQEQKRKDKWDGTPLATFL